MAKRLQSPSSINLYKQCPRRYFYQYILKVKTEPNIHCIRGNIVHSALEKFFDLDPSSIDTSKLRSELASYLKNLFDAYWAKSRPSLAALKMEPEQLQFYYDDSVQQLANWLNRIFSEIDANMRCSDFASAFAMISPVDRELELRSESLSVRGYIDFVQKDADGIAVMDYKTSKKFDITPEYRLQLGIYAVLYQEKFGTPPDKVGIWFLKDKPKVFAVDDDLLKEARFEIEQIHFATESSEISAYPQKPSPLCRYSTGQCDFFNICQPFKNGY